jgi:hypothetical protein
MSIGPFKPLAIAASGRSFSRRIRAASTIGRIATKKKLCFVGTMLSNTYTHP